ncbi:acetyl-coenzyme A synthetase N-terminal domain-containing protein [Saccharopolyspora sp. NPDC000995]
MSDDAALDDLLHETRRFPPPEDLAANANVTADVCETAARDPLPFWDQAARRLTWAHEGEQVLDWQPPNQEFAGWLTPRTD